MPFCTMQKLSQLLIITILTFSNNLADFQKTSTTVQHSTHTHNKLLCNMENAWIPIRRNGRGRGNQSRGAGGGRGGRLAPAAAGRIPPRPSSPITSRLSVQQTIPSDTDALLDAFLQVITSNMSHRTTMDVHHVKKSTVVLQSHGYSYLDHNGILIVNITASTSNVSLELCYLCLREPLLSK